MDFKNYKLSLKLQNGEIELSNIEEDEDMYFVGFDLKIKINKNIFSYQLSNSYLEKLYAFAKKQDSKLIYDKDSYISFSKAFIEILMVDSNPFKRKSESYFKIYINEENEEEQNRLEEFFIELKALCEMLYHY